ncbi:MAG TPA: arginine N-succinyltransferase [Opitutales bacterium]|nr:arginine N-succinyltransferase [Opitutales bacterium]
MTHKNSSKFIIRPVRENDYEAFLELATLTGGALTNIPKDPEIVRARVEDSERSFDLRTERPGSHRYLFFLEDRESGEIAGTCGIISKVGGFQPFYTYEIRNERFSYPPLEIDHEVKILSPKINHDGPSEICCLFLRPEFRRSGLGRLLSLSRFHFMGAFPRRFDKNVLAELRGTTEDRSSPFWDGVARHFFKMDFREADYLSGLDDKEFIAELMPKHPLYLPLLPPEAVAAIGQPHRDAVPALKVLLGEGFRYQNQIDIFDAGPIVESPLTSIRTIQKRREARVEKIADDLPDSDQMLLSNAQIDFRACIGRVAENGESVSIDRATAEALKIEKGHTVAFSPLFSPAEISPEQLSPPFLQPEKTPS